ncbi:MAG: TetR/AcrR family transcriptional regulator [Sphingomonas sp.]
MPKIVDHDQQRREIAKAAIRWIADHGVDTLSQRNVAALSGRSKGAVQYYFPDKASLMFGALRQVSEERQERERAGPAAAADPLETLARRLVASLPIDRERADEWRVRLSLYLYAARDETMQAYLADHAEAILAHGAAEVAAAQASGAIHRGLDPRVTFRRLSAAVSGIAVARLATGELLDEDEQRAVLTEVVRAIAANSAD